jgi:membrane protease YdiL (CAAX protease family)
VVYLRVRLLACLIMSCLGINSLNLSWHRDADGYMNRDPNTNETSPRKPPISFFGAVFWLTIPFLLTISIIAVFREFLLLIGEQTKQYDLLLLFRVLNLLFLGFLGYLRPRIVWFSLRPRLVLAENRCECDVKLGLQLCSKAHMLLVLLMIPCWLFISSAFPTRADSLFLHSWQTSFFIGCVITAPCEEVFFRRFLGEGLTARYGTLCGIVLASLLFGISHLSPMRIVVAALFAIQLHLVYCSCNTVIAPILWHFLHNLCCFALYNISQNVATANIIPILLGPSWSALWIAILVQMVLIFSLVSITWKQKETRTYPDRLRA